MVQMEKIFSESVLADTLPKPTLVRLLRAKYSDVTVAPEPPGVLLLPFHWPEPSNAAPPSGSNPELFHWLHGALRRVGDSQQGGQRRQEVRRSQAFGQFMEPAWWEEDPEELLQQTQTYIPGGGAITFDLAASDEVPDAGHPMAEQGERGHEQGEDHGAVLGVAVQLLEEAQEAEEAHRLQQDIAAARRVARRGAAVLSYLRRGEADVVGNGDGDVEGGQQDQPIPAGLERTVVEEDETRLLDVRHLVLRDRVRIGSQETLDLSLGLVLFLEVSRQLVEDGAAAASLHVQTRRAADLVDLQARFLV
ncbi:hypothetical protein EYF80_019466 [Liparis tanakae]|uniref:Uncharacterized protein n=1 Tax=Liparis tanakae TaxID=230148 RepID=A0A4Z2HZ72_9TELE|nr:hypothetical protein EYF80_019466 [Liparis tanakae]